MAVLVFHDFWEGRNDCVGYGFNSISTIRLSVIFAGDQERLKDDGSSLYKIHSNEFFNDSAQGEIRAKKGM